MYAKVAEWFDATIVDLQRQFRWSFLPPLMVYFAAGLAGLAGIVGTFFVKEYLGLSAAFLAGLAFWAGLPWALKMPLGHLVDIIWRWKAILVYLGAALIAASFVIMYALISHTGPMSQVLPVDTWYVIAALLAPCGYVVQDAVADAMSVEAVPRFDDAGKALDVDTSKALHTTMQTLGRIALIGGLVVVAVLNIFMFAGVEDMNPAQKADIYARIYLLALLVPLISISGVVLAAVMKHRRRQALSRKGFDHRQIEAALERPGEPTEPNYWYFGGGLAFVGLAMLVGIGNVPFAQEIVFIGSMTVVLILMRQLVRELEPAKARALFGTAIIIFVFRAVPLPGPGVTWFEIDILGFDQQFLSVLTLITSVLTLLGMILLRPLMASRTIVFVIVLLTLAAGLLSLPNIGLFYGLHHWTEPLTAGIVDARFIALMDTAIGIAPRPDCHDPHAGLDCPQCAGQSQGHLFCCNGLVHQSCVVGQQPADPLHERVLRHHPRGSRPHHGRT